MKINRRVVIILLILMLPHLSILRFSPINADYDGLKEEKLNLQIIEEKELTIPKASGFWNVDFIHIKNDNWSATDLPWIQNHTGTWDDPHIIENVTINGLNKTSCIFIENSIQHFIIRNCTLYNSSSEAVMGFDHAGIRLYNVNNSILINNNCSYNQRCGIVLLSCNNITILDNIAKNNTLHGLKLMMTHNSIISGNSMIINNMSGIRTENCINNSYYENTVKNNTEMGFSLTQECNSTVFKNIIMNNGIYGIELKWMSENTTIYNNVFIGNKQWNAFDDGDILNIKNRWDNDYIGNYWDNYSGVDGNGDGIGDTFHFINTTGIPANVDTKPIFENPIHQGEKVHIDDTGASALTWAQTELVKWWCNGKGTKSNPYVISDLRINGGGIGSCILIENSNVYSKIENCTVSNCQWDIYNYAGIKLLKTNYSTIENNTCSNNQGNGILLYENCNKNTILANIVKNNDHFGISFDEGCHNNLIIGNIVDGNTETGINLGGIYTGYYENNFNNISNNIVTKNFYGGITTGGLGNNFSGNYIFNNTEWGTDLAGLEDFGNYTIFSENVVIGNYFYLMGWYSILHNNIFINVSLGISSWFKEQTCSHTISVTNTVNDGILYYYANKNGLTNENFTGKVGQIIIANCNNSLISELSLSNWSSIRLYYSCYNTILNINLTNDADIRLQYSSDHNFITNCYFEDSGDLYLWTSNNNTIFSNIFKDGEGVLLIMSHYNNLTGNIVINTDFGILISSSNYTIISENYISNNNVGITLDGGGWDTVANNNITNNIIENNKIGIKFIAYSQENLIRDNSIINSSKVGIHIEFGCNNNLFYRNAFIKNNRSHAWDEGDFNQWDNGIIGNYWDNYTERGGFDNNNDGIGDINYTIYDRSKIFAANDTKPIFENPIHNGEKIYIDGTGVSALNWTQTVLVKYWCTGSGKEQNPYIIKNLVINGSGSGNCILIANSSVFFTIENCKVFNCSPSGGAGIRLESVNNSLIIRNNCSDNNYGIILSKCYDNLIHDNSIFKKASGERYGIYIEYSNKNNITNNLIYDFSGNAFGSGIDLFLSNYSFVKNNIVFNHRVGISIIFYGIHNNFSGNIIYNNSVGLVLKGKYNTAYNNTVKFNSAEGGIYISGNNNTIIMNNVYNNTHGIWVTEGYNNTIIHNSVSNNTWGIDLRPDIPMFPAVKIYENYIKNNSLTLNEYGVVIWKANFTVIYMNIISYNTEIGILIDKSEYSTKNLIYFNSFIGNKIHAIDNGTTNYWNSSVIGNYWDNYTGVDDLAPFGIGDTPHNITGTAGSKDYLPIYKGSGTTPEPEPTPSPTDGGNGGGNGGDGKEEFDIIEFLTSPVGITVIGSSIAAVAVITIIKKKGSGKSRVKEIERIERIRNE